MSKNIIIQEGGTNYQFTAKKLKTDKVGGGSVLWVPEDEVNVIKKRITENGKYIASSEDAYGYKIVNVNVKGGKGSADSSGKPKTTIDSDGYVENAPGGIGSAVIGTDPNTGEWVTVGVDSGGNLVSTPVPAGIDIVTNPSKINYSNGETINYSGIAVDLKTKSGNTFTNSTYPNGRIPMQELIFPMQVADFDDPGTPTSDLDLGAVTQPVPHDTHAFAIRPNKLKRIMETVDCSFVVLFFTGNDLITFFGGTSNLGKCNFRSEGTPIDFTSGVNASWTYLNKTVYYNQPQYGGGGWDDLSGAYPLATGDVSSLDRIYWNHLAWTLTYGGDSAKIISCPVRWLSPYSGDTFEDSFDIIVHKQSSGGSNSGQSGNIENPSGGGYSDDSGGSSSGGGGGF